MVVTETGKRAVGKIFFGKSEYFLLNLNSGGFTRRGGVNHTCVSSVTDFFYLLFLNFLLPEKGPFVFDFRFMFHPNLCFL